MYIKPGKITKANIEANRELNKIYKAKGIYHCEIGAYFNYEGVFKACWRVRQGYAHKDNRIEYRGRLDDLAKFSETLSACNHCHAIIDKPENYKLKIKLYEALRGNKMMKKIKAPANKKPKKANWMLPHKCINCKKTVSSLLCTECGQMSVKIESTK